MIKLTRIGYSQKTHGKDGRLSIHVEKHFLDSLATSEVIFIDLKGSKVPFLIESIEHTNKLLVKLEEINGPDEATKLAGNDIYLPSELINDSAYLGQEQNTPLEGYKVYDQNDSLIGVIEEIEELPQHVLAIIKTQRQLLRIPLHKDLILELDKTGKKIKIDMPEGLTEL